MIEAQHLFGRTGPELIDEARCAKVRGVSKLHNGQSREEIEEMFASLGEVEAMRQLRFEIEHSPEEIAEFRRLIDERPDYGRQVKAIVEYARERGGLTLEAWRPMNGPWFGEPMMMSIAVCAEKLGVPVAAVEAIMNDTSEAIRPRLEPRDTGSGAPKCSRTDRA